jgi:hypothetical protein
MRKSTIGKLALGLAVTLLLGGCTKDKAEAIKNAAEQFRAESIAALAEIKSLFRQQVGMPVESQDKIISRMAQDFAETSDLGAEQLDAVLKDAAASNPQFARADRELFDKLEARYNAFAAMFASLPEGSYLAAKSVKQAEKHAVNLTSDLINLAATVEKNPFQITSRRVLLLEQIQNDRQVTVAAERKKLLERDAAEAFQLQLDEAQAKQRAILGCLKAAETSRTVAHMIRNYRKMSASDILIAGRELLSFSAEVSGGNVNVTALLTKYKGIEETIRTDPYWSPLLDKPLNQ